MPHPSLSNPDRIGRIVVILLAAALLTSCGGRADQPTVPETEPAEFSVGTGRLAG
jgi:hypothetical protein